MKTAIIGAGHMGRRHVEAANHLKIVGVCDFSKDALLKVSKEQNIPESALFTSSSKMLAQTKPDCLIIATTAPSHFDLVKSGIDAGCKYILCEKPMATSLKECDDMIVMAKNADVQLAINHQMRFMNTYLIAKSILNSEEFGGVKSINVIAGNFGLSMNATHYFEMFRFLTDDTVETVNAWFSEEKVENPRGPQFEDRAGSVRAVSSSGKRLYIECGADQGHGLTVTYNARNGQVVIDELTGKITSSLRKKEFRDYPTSKYALPSEYNEEIAEVDIIDITRKTLDALISGVNYPTGEQGRKSVEILVAAHISANNGSKTINLGTDDLGRDHVFPWA